MAAFLATALLALCVGVAGCDSEPDSAKEMRSCAAMCGTRGVKRFSPTVFQPGFQPSTPVTCNCFGGDSDGGSQ